MPASIRLPTIDVKIADHFVTTSVKTSYFFVRHDCMVTYANASNPGYTKSLAGDLNTCGSFADGDNSATVTTIPKLVKPKAITTLTSTPLNLCGRGSDTPILDQRYLGTRPNFLASPTNLVPVTGCLYLVDDKHVRRITLSNPISQDFFARTELIAGSLEAGCADGPASLARFSNPTGIVAGGGKVFVADGGCRAVRALSFDAITNAATVSTLVGGCASGTACAGYPWVDGVGTAAVLSAELGQLDISTDESTLYLADSTANRLRAVDISSRTVYTIAGNSTFKPPIWETVAGTSILRAAVGGADGDGGTATFNRVNGVVASSKVDNPGNRFVYVLENPTGRVRAVGLNAPPTPTQTAAATPRPTSSRSAQATVRSRII